MNFESDFVQVSKLSEDQKKKWNTFFPQILVKAKKKGFTKNGTPFFSKFKWTPTHTRVKLLGGCRCRPYSNYLRGYSQIISPNNVPLLVKSFFLAFTRIWGKKCSIFFFFFGLHLICSPEQNRCRDSSPPMLKIGQNWGKIANYSPNARQRSTPLRVYFASFFQLLLS